MSEEENKPVENEAPETPLEAAAEAAPAESEAPEQSGHGHAPVDPDKPVNPDFQDNDIHLDTVRRFMFGSLGVTLVFFVLMLIVHRFYTRSFTNERGGQPEVRQIPTRGPILQTQPLVDLAEYKELENERLNTLVNGDAHAVVPVDDMMRLMIEQQAFPTASARPETPAPAAAASTPASPAPAPAAPAAPAAAPVVASAQPVLDPAMVEQGKQLWTTNCVICHTGQAGAIAPNIVNAFGTMRELEGADPILMDEGYVINSMNNPNEHIAKGYPPVMPTQFKTQFTRAQKLAIVEYLKSESQVQWWVSDDMPAEEEEAPAAPVAEPVPVVEEAPAPVPAPAPAAPVPAPAPVEPAPEPAPAPAPGRPAPIFI